MKQYYKQLKTRKLFQCIKLSILCSGIAFLLHGCFLKQDRTTTVYGTITDEKGQPVDSILILLDGVKGFNQYETLKQLYSNANGNYELVLEVPRKYGSVDVGIPFFPGQNAKFDKNYKGFKLYKNDVATNNCCSAIIGQKTKYDFQLIPK